MIESRAATEVQHDSGHDRFFFFSPWRSAMSAQRVFFDGREKLGKEKKTHRTSYSGVFAAVQPQVTTVNSFKQILNCIPISVADHLRSLQTRTIAGPWLLFIWNGNQTFVIRASSTCLFLHFAPKLRGGCGEMRRRPARRPTWGIVLKPAPELCYRDWQPYCREKKKKKTSGNINLFSLIAFIGFPNKFSKAP